MDILIPKYSLMTKESAYLSSLTGGDNCLRKCNFEPFLHLRVFITCFPGERANPKAFVQQIQIFRPV